MRLARRRPGHHRHVGQQARRPRGHPRRVQADRHQRRRACRSPSTCRRWPQVADKVTHRPLAVPHHPVARPGHGLHDDRQQADRRRCSTRRWARSPPKLLTAEAGVPPYVTFGDLRNGTAGARRLPRHRRTTRSSSRAAAAARAKRRRGGSFRVRGITLPAGFTLDELEKRDALLRKLRQRLHGGSTSRTTSSTASTPSTSRRSKSCAPTRPARRSTWTPRSRPSASCYGTTPFGQGALAARRLVEAGVRFVTVSLGGWDTHGQNFNAHKTRLLPPLDQTLVGPDRGPRRPRPARQHDRLCAPASSAGRRRSTRTPAATTGRGRWPCVLAGGGFKRGYVHGTPTPAAWPRRPTRARRTTWPARSSTTSASTRTPELQTPTGRPVQLFREGKVIEKLIGEVATRSASRSAPARMDILPE